MPLFKILIFVAKRFLFNEIEFCYFACFIFNQGNLEIQLQSFQNMAQHIPNLIELIEIKDKGLLLYLLNVGLLTKEHLN